MKKLTAILVMLAMSATFAACGDNGEASVDGDVNEDVIVTSDEPATESKSETEAQTEEKTEAETTVETEVEDEDSDLYSYYEVLSKEYERTSSLMVRTYNKHCYVNEVNFDVDIIVDGDLVLFLVEKSGYTVYTYDIIEKKLVKKMELGEIEEELDRCEFVGYYEGKIYFRSFRNYSIVKIVDIEEESLQTFIPNDHADNVYCDYYWDGWNVTNGVMSFQNSDTDVQRIIFTSDFEQFPVPMKSVGHGIEEAACMYYLNVWGEYVYFVDDGIIYRHSIYDVSGDWEQMSYSDWDNQMTFSNWDKLNDPYITIGSYNVNAYGIWDTNTGNFWADISDGRDFAKSYFGGDSNTILHDGYWYRVQYSSEGSHIDYSEYEPLSKESKANGGEVFRVNDTYYIIVDNYGIFLRTYEKGETEEETIMMFE